MTLKDVELLVKPGDIFRSLDIAQDTNFSFNLQMTDVTNPTAVLNPYSAQISIPRTKGNNDIFNHIYQLDHVVTTVFNPLIRTDFQLYVNGSLYQTGYMKLESINEKEYNIRLYGGLGDLFYTLSEVSDVRDMRLKSLPFGDFFNHIISSPFIANCWNSDYFKKTYHDYASGADITDEEVLTYAMSYQGQYDNFDSDSVLDTNNEIQEAYWVNLAGTQKYASPVLDEHKRNSLLSVSVIRTGEFRSYYQRPAIKLKVLYNKIIEQAINAGWTINFDSTFFNSNNPYWNNLYILFPQYKFEGETSKNNIIIGEKNTDWKSSVVNQRSGDSVIGISTDYSNRIQGGRQYYIDVNVSFNLAAVNNVDYRHSYYSYFRKINPLTITPVVAINNVEYPLDSIELNDQILGSRYVSYFDDGYLDYNDAGEYSFLYSIGGDPYSYKGNTWNFQFSRNFDAAELTGDIPFEIRFKVSGDTWYRGIDFLEADIDAEMSLGVIINSNSNAKIIPIPDDTLRSLSQIKYTDIVNSDKTCFDFMINYGKIFGLYYVKDDKSKTVDIVTRKTFFSNIVKTDWTGKIDYSKGTELQPVPFTYKTGVFKWKNAGTKYEQQYLENSDKEYGSLTFDTGYQFSNEKNDYLENMFANCIVASDYSQYYAGRSDTAFKDNKTLPYLADRDGKGTESGMALLFKNGFSSANRNFFISDDFDMMTEGFCWNDYPGIQISSYPKFTRIFSNANGVYSLNFGRPSIAYNDDEATLIDSKSNNGSETIYSRFWKSYINDLFNVNNKVLTVYVLLDISDISGINGNLFNRFVSINNTLWVVSKVYGFNPLSKAPVKVDLIKVQTPENYISQNY